MMKEYLVSPVEKDDEKTYLRAFPMPTTADELERFLLLKKTFDKKWTVAINTDEPDFLELFIADGSRKKYTVQTITQSLKTAGCSCNEFKTNHLGYCEHFAVIERIRNGYILESEQEVWHAVLGRLYKLPTRRAGYKGRKMRFFLPFEQRYITVGSNNGIAEDCVGIPEFEVIDYNARYEQFYSQNPNVVSAGLLNNVVLYDYQEEIFVKMLAAQRCICSMIMGAGKTLTSIAAFEWLRQNKRPDFRMLIIAPKSLKIQWGSEIKKAIGLNTFQINNVADAATFEKLNSQIGAVTYQFAARNVELFQKMNFDIIILDEMQYVRNGESKTWKAISKLQAPYMFGLSGTIIENRLEDLHSVMEILAPNYLGPKWKFNMEFQVLQNINRSSAYYKGTKNISALREKLKNFLFSYHKLDLPKLHHTNHFVKMTNNETRLHDSYYEQAKVLMAKMMSSGLGHGEKMMLQAFLLKARQSTDSERLITKQKAEKSEKLKKLTCLIEELCVNNNEKIVIFSSWTEMLAIIAEHVKHEFPEIGFVFFTGAENMKQRAVAIEQFKTNSKIMLFLASDAGGLGVDGLQFAATNVIHTELPWNPAKIDQRNARLHRIGQKKEVFSHYLVAEQSIETTMLDTLYNKRAIRNEVLYHDMEPVGVKPNDTKPVAVSFFESLHQQNTKKQEQPKQPSITKSIPLVNRFPILRKLMPAF